MLCPVYHEVSPMPEEYEVGTDRAQELIDEKREAGLRESRPRWIDLLAVSTALFAVLAAVAALHAGDKANESLLTANRAVLIQTQAVDSWMEFQADSIKKSQQLLQAQLLGKVGGTQAEVAAARNEAARRQTLQDKLKLEASRRDAETTALSKESGVILREHQRYALAVTLFQIAIGLSAIAALLRFPVIWWVSLLAGSWAAAVLVTGLLGKG